MSQTVDRRPFRIAAALALIVSITMGCGGGATSPTTPAPPPTGSPAPAPAAGVVGTVSENHPLPHSAVITEAPLDAGGALTLDIQGAASHAHEVWLTAAEVAQIARGARISTASSTNPHSLGTGFHNHTITFN